MTANLPPDHCERRCDGARAVIYMGRLSVYAEPSMTADDGTVAVGIDWPALAELVSAARGLQWNVEDGHRSGSRVIVERESWSALRSALARLDSLETDEEQADG